MMAKMVGRCVPLMVILVVLTWLDTTTACPSQCQCRNGMANCVGAGLQTPPSNLPSDIVRLDLSRNNIHVLSRRSFSNMANVQSIHMRGNRLTHLRNRIFQGVPNLMTLDLTSNKISRIDNRAFSGLSHLLTLALTMNELRSIGNFLQKTTGLYSLNFAFNKLTRIEENDFKKNSQLKMMDLSNNHISRIHPNAFNHLPLLRILALNRNPLVTLPDLQFSSDMLKLVDFTECKLTHVPKTLPSSVRDLRLGSNNITQITADDFNNITDLQLLTLNDNRIRLIEYRSFYHLNDLRELWLSRNEVINIPRGLPANLKSLRIDFNQVYEIEDRLFDENSHLEHLSMEMNKVSLIAPEALHGLPSLKSINLQGNMLEEIATHSFYNLSKLEMLKLSNNPIKIFHQGAILDLTNLTSLAMAYIYSDRVTLADNLLLNVPRLQRLELMNSPVLSAKLLERIPNTPPMPRVEYVNLQYNDLVTLPQDIKRVFPNAQILLDGNIWHCDRRLLWLREYMLRSEKSFHTYEEPVCETPLNLNGKAIVTIPASEFVPVSDQSIQNRHSPADISAADQFVSLKSEDGIANPTSLDGQESDLSGTKQPLYISIAAEPQVADTKPTKKKRKGRGRKRGRKGKRKRRHKTKGKGKKRCRVQKDGTVKCRKRKGKGKGKKKQTNQRNDSTLNLLPTDVSAYA